MGKLNLKSRYEGAALITGASGGLGETFARQCAAEGMDLVLVARSKDKLESLATELSKAHGIQAHTISQDLTASDCAEKIKKEVDAKGITVGLLINNAGFGSQGLFHELDGANEIKMVDLNCRTPIALTAAFAPAMVRRGKGGIMFLASIAAYQPTPWFATYGATKTFNLMMGEALWAELGQFGVDVITLSPGYTRTEFQKNADVTSKPLAGWSDPDDVVRRGLRLLGRKPSTIPGFLNWFMAWTVRFTPRALMAKLAYILSKPPKSKSAAAATA